LEDMMLKVKRTHIQDGSTVAFGATVMGGSVIEPNTTILPLSLVLKEMIMTTGTYEGSPAQPVMAPLARTENSIRVDHVSESPSVSGDGRSVLPFPGPVRLAVPLGKDAPIHRAIQHVGRIASVSVLGGLHQHYCRI